MDWGVEDERSFVSRLDLADHHAFSARKGGVLLLLGGCWKDKPIVWMCRTQYALDDRLASMFAVEQMLELCWERTLFGYFSLTSYGDFKDSLRLAGYLGFTHIGDYEKNGRPVKVFGLAREDWYGRE